MKLISLKNNEFVIISISFFLILPKWLMSYYYFAGEDISFRIINEIQDIYYLPLIQNISDLFLSPIYSNNIESKQFIFSFPVLNFAILSIFYKFLGSYSFIFLEFLFTFLFLLIFFKIFKHLKFENLISILISVILFTSPIILHYLDFFDYEFITLIKMNFETFYSLRYPRPIMTNLLLFGFFLILLNIYYNEHLDSKLFLLLGTISGLTLHSFYFFFIFQNFLLFLIIVFKYKKNIINHLIDSFKLYVIYVIPIMIFIILFLINVNYSDPDYYERLGVIKLDADKRSILFTYFFNFISNKLFLTLILLNFLAYFLFKVKNNFFLLFFISTVLSTFIFISFSTSVVDIYHFFNWIIVSGLLSLLIPTFFYINSRLSKTRYRLRNFLIFSCTIILIFFHNLNQFSKYQNYNSEKRNSQNELIKFISSNNETLIKKEILLLDSETFIWLVLNNYNNFTYVPENMWTVRDNDQLEKDIISVFHFFNLSNQDFYSYIKNKKKNFRMLNNNAMRILGRKYLANKLYTYNNSDDFDDIAFIKQIKPTIGHSFAIPNYEINRLLDKFKSQQQLILPKFIIFDITKDALFYEKKYTLNNYCTIFSNSNYEILSLKSTEKLNC